MSVFAAEGRKKRKTSLLSDIMTCAFVWQIPRYILTLHELLAHTPHEHVERNSLDYAKSKLEELSRYSTSNCASSTPMHDHVSTSLHNFYSQVIKINCYILR